MITSFIGQNSVPITRTLVLRHNRLCPAGAVSPFAGAAAPDGWLMCDGSEYLIIEYNKLYEIIGNTYGSAGSGKFRLPDMRSRFPLAAGVDTELSDRALADKGGEESHALSVPELPSHSHGVTDPGHTHMSVVQNGVQNIVASSDLPGISAADEPTTTTSTTSSTTGISIQNTGEGQAHNTMPPFLVLNYIIKY